MLNNFILTYSVIAQTSATSDKEKAQKVRDKIATLAEWDKLTDVDTVFIGVIDASGTEDSSKKRNAQQIIEKAILPILKEFHANENDVVVCCAMMLDNVKKPFTFDIKY